MTLYRPSGRFKGQIKRLVVQGALVPVEPDTIRWCLNHRKETWAGRTTCVGMGAADLCNVVDALLIIGEETP